MQKAFTPRRAAALRPRAEPGDDLVSALVAAGDNVGTDGAADGLTGNELLSTVFR